MPIDDKKISKNKVQNLLMENRERLSISGVIDVSNFNTECVIMETELGLLTVKGEELRISKLNLENAELVIEGEIISCVYSDEDKGSKGLSKMFR